MPFIISDELTSDLFTVAIIVGEEYEEGDDDGVDEEEEEEEEGEGK